jgi:hypothetical protein
MTIAFQSFKKIKCDLCSIEKSLCKSKEDFKDWLTLKWEPTAFYERNTYVEQTIELCPSCSILFKQFREGIMREYQK